MSGPEWEPIEGITLDQCAEISGKMAKSGVMGPDAVNAFAEQHGVPARRQVERRAARLDPADADEPPGDEPLRHALLPGDDVAGAALGEEVDVKFSAVLLVSVGAVACIGAVFVPGFARIGMIIGGLSMIAGGVFTWFLAGALTRAAVGDVLGAGLARRAAEDRRRVVAG